MTPVFNGRDLLVCQSHGANSGARALRLSRLEDRTAVEQLWFDRRVFFGNVRPALMGDYLLGSKERIVTCVDIKTGSRVWVERAFNNAICMVTGGKLLAYDLNGSLGIATATAEGLTVHSSCQVTERVSLTPPTLVGTTLYLRDRKHIMALDLSASGNS
jgi:hypothetical protein